MSNLADYVMWRGDLPMEYDGFNELDAAVFARISYLPFELVIPDGGAGRELYEVCAYLTAVPDIGERVRRKGDLDICRLISECRRYKGVKVYDYVSVWNEQSQTQFAAITYALADGRCCIAYRGTDNTLIGWKEDLNMGLTFPVPAQKSAAEYFDKQAAAFPDSPFIICGHSKGGNLAVYAAAFCGETQNRIAAVYNFDGPGFEKYILDMDCYRSVEERIHTFVPQFSIVGMLLDNGGKYTVVKSSASGIMQHDIGSWQTRRGGFEYLPELDEGSRKLDSTLDAWINDMTPEEREGFVEAVYQILTQNNARTLEDLGANGWENALATVKTLKKLDEKTRGNALRAVRLLVGSLKTGVLAPAAKQ